MTDDEYEALKAHCRERKIRMTPAFARRFVHETLRRRNEPYESPETKLCVRLSPDDLEFVRAEAARVGMSLQEYGFLALATADPERIVAAREWLTDQEEPAA